MAVGLCTQRKTFRRAIPRLDQNTVIGPVRSNSCSRIAWDRPPLPLLVRKNLEERRGIGICRVRCLSQHRTVTTAAPSPWR